MVAERSLGLALSLLPLLASCQGSRGPEAQPAASSTQTGATVPPPPAASGPLAALDPNTAKPESWLLEKGPVPFMNFEAQHLRISASCRLPSGQMDCEALRFARGGPQVELTAKERGRMMAPGAAICMHLQKQLVTGRDPKGNEDGFCVFGDGSMIATGSLEYHTLKQ